MTVHNEVVQQKVANKASLPYFSEFQSHRDNQTDLIMATDLNVAGKICLLGAGNCYDVDLSVVAERFQEIHLVDIDSAAITAARKRLPKQVAKKVFLHAPLDISGANSKLERWRDMQVKPEELIDFPEWAAKNILKKLPISFDLVVSSCVLSQILLTCRRVLSETHPLINAALITAMITHIRILTALTNPGGQALFITDISSSEIAPLKEVFRPQNGLECLESLIANNQVFNFLTPNMIAELTQQDPYFSARATMSEPLRAWLWNNGPWRSYLVYASRISVSNFNRDKR